ncbi:MAG: hypothetical protein LBC93_06895 [Synergistaceae bacterium]|jgi:hypothetical protein|nr:hypothetical protein [Synergistaceae bacterium]
MSGGSGLFGDWDRAIQLLGNNPIKRALDLARNQIGVTGASMVKKGIIDGAPGGTPFWPLHPKTIERKGSSKPLIGNGDLIGSVTHQLVGDSDIWIGVRRGARAGNGQDAADIAEVHEYGAVIPVTAKMKAYLHYIGIHLKPDTEYIAIPPRSFLRTIFNSRKFHAMISRKIINALRRALPFD